MAAEPLPTTPSEDLAGIRLLCCDIDGVLTDGGLYYSDGGSRYARFHVRDGMGLKRVQAAGVKLAFISQSLTSYIPKRARDLGVDYTYTGIEDKLTSMKDILSQEDFGLDAVAHIADDVNDIGLLEAVGLPLTVPGGVAEVQAICRYVTRAEGGDGAVRELCDAILASKAAFG